MITNIRDITSFKWGTVTGTAPIAVQLDGDTAPLALVPDSLVDPALLVIGDRVRVELSQRKVVIHGTSQGNFLDRAGFIAGQVSGLKFATGVVTTVSSISAGSGINVAVVFPVGYFSVTPAIWGIFNNGRPTVSLQTAPAPTSAGATFRLDNWSPGSVASGADLRWFAIGT